MESTPTHNMLHMFEALFLFELDALKKWLYATKNIFNVSTK